VALGLALGAAAVADFGLAAAARNPDADYGLYGSVAAVLFLSVWVFALTRLGTFVGKELDSWCRRRPSGGGPGERL
jgi:hypothetical protein